MFSNIWIVECCFQELQSMNIVPRLKLAEAWTMAFLDSAKSAKLEVKDLILWFCTYWFRIIGKAHTDVTVKRDRTKAQHILLWLYQSILNFIRQRDKLYSYVWAYFSECCHYILCNLLFTFSWIVNDCCTCVMDLPKVKSYNFTIHQHFFFFKDFCPFGTLFCWTNDNTLRGRNSQRHKGNKPRGIAHGALSHVVKSQIREVD